MKTINKKHPLVLVQSETPSEILKENGVFKFHPSRIEVGGGVEYYKLHAVSEGSWSLGDYVSHGLVDLIYQVNEDNMEASLVNKVRRVVATNDRTIRVPQFHNDFIKAWIEAGTPSEVYLTYNFLGECNHELVINHPFNVVEAQLVKEYDGRELLAQFLYGEVANEPYLLTKKLPSREFDTDLNLLIRVIEKLKGMNYKTNFFSESNYVFIGWSDKNAIGETIGDSRAEFVTRGDELGMNITQSIFHTAVKCVAYINAQPIQ